MHLVAQSDTRAIQGKILDLEDMYVAIQHIGSRHQKKTLGRLFWHLPYSVSWCTDWQKEQYVAIHLKRSGGLNSTSLFCIQTILAIYIFMDNQTSRTIPFKSNSSEKIVLLYSPAKGGKMFFQYSTSDLHLHPWNWKKRQQMDLKRAAALLCLSPCIVVW